VTEAEARAALAAFDGVGGLERWMADRPWQAVPGGPLARALRVFLYRRGWPRG
jgi:hypothetical protein